MSENHLKTILINVQSNSVRSVQNVIQFKLMVTNMQSRSLRAFKQMCK